MLRNVLKGHFFTLIFDQKGYGFLLSSFCWLLKLKSFVMNFLKSFSLYSNFILHLSKCFLFFSLQSNDKMKCVTMRREPPKPPKPPPHQNFEETIHRVSFLLHSVGYFWLLNERRTIFLYFALKEL